MTEKSKVWLRNWCWHVVKDLKDHTYFDWLLCLKNWFSFYLFSLKTHFNSILSLSFISPFFWGVLSDYTSVNHNKIKHEYFWLISCWPKNNLDWVVLSIRKSWAEKHCVGVSEQTTNCTLAWAKGKCKRFWIQLQQNKATPNATLRVDDHVFWFA